MPEVVVLTPEELEEIVTSAIERATANGNGDGVPKRWLNASELARYLGVASKTVQNLSGPKAADPIPYHQLTAGGEKRFLVDEVDEWVRRRRER
jgi:Helix-turn-helix domain